MPNKAEKRRRHKKLYPVIKKRNNFAMRRRINILRRMARPPGRQKLRGAVSVLRRRLERDAGGGK
jgi:hypothetical protein